jgi:hypothetical protein
MDQNNEENSEAVSTDEASTETEETEAPPTNFAIVAACLNALKTIVVPATSDEVKAIKSATDKLVKARDLLAGFGMDTAEIETQIEALQTSETEADAGRAELADELATLERTAKLVGARVSGQRVTMLAEKYAEQIADGVAEFPGACEMKPLANGKERAVHGSREVQIVSALLNLSQNGRYRVPIEGMAAALQEVDDTFGDLESCTSQIRTTLQGFGDVWTKGGNFTFAANG